MGCCLSCIESLSRSKSGESSSNGRETELAPSSSSSTGNQHGQGNMTVSRAMSSATIELQPDDWSKASGYGMALVGVAIEQDAAYWEAHVEVIAEQSSTGESEVMLGVATKKDRQFFNELQEQKGGDAPLGSDYMRRIKVSSGDVVGIAVQQSDLPMLQFLRNGEPLHDLAINRFRGTVYPSLFLFHERSEGLVVRMVFRESEFQQLPPNVRFGPLIAARGII